MSNVEVQHPKPTQSLHVASAKLISFIEEDMACQRLLIEAIRQLDCVRTVHDIRLRVVKPEGIYIIGCWGTAKAIAAVEGMLGLLPQYQKLPNGGRIGTGEVVIGITYNPPET